MQRSCVPQCLSAGLASAAWLRAGTLPRPHRGPDDGFGRRGSGHRVAERAFEEAGHPETMNQIPANGDDSVLVATGPSKNPALWRFGTVPDACWDGETLPRW